MPFPGYKPCVFLDSWHREIPGGTHGAQWLQRRGFPITRNGKHTKSDIENGPVEIVDFAIKHGGSFQFVMLVRLPEGNNHSWFIHL